MSLRVLWLTKGLGRGGAERLLVGTAAGLDRSRVDVEVAYLLPWKDAFVPDLEAVGVRCHCLGAKNDLDGRWLVRLRRLLRERDFDIVHTHMPYAALGARAVCGRSGPAIVHTEHNEWPRYRPLTRWANALSYGRNQAVIAVSQGVARTIQPPLPGSPPTEVVIHGVDINAVARGPAARSEARQRLGLPADAAVVGTVGNFTPKKDQATLLRAVAELLPGHPHLHVVLLGMGPLENDLRRLAQDLGISPRVHMPGSRDDVYELLAGFDVFALPSRHEGLSIALLEALAAELPVVATKVGGIPEVVTHDHNALLVAPGDQRSFTEALGTVLGDPDVAARLRSHALDSARAHDLRPAIERTQRIYEEVVGR